LITLEVRGGQLIVDRLRALSRDMDNMVPAMKIVGLMVQRVIQRHFTSSKDPEGAPWVPLAKATLERRRNRGNAKPLIDTGRLVSSIAYRVTQSEVAVGTNVVYSAMQNFGSRDGKVPARRFVGVNAGDQAEIVRELDVMMDRVLRRNGLKGE
jgi:phage gpG-like protein